MLRNSSRAVVCALSLLSPLCAWAADGGSEGRSFGGLRFGAGLSVTFDTGSNERVFAALQFLESPSVAREWEGICREKTSFFLPEFERYKAEARESYRARLAAEGLSGSALVPADACNPFLKEAREELAKRFRQAVAAGLGLS